MVKRRRKRNAANSPALTHEALNRLNKAQRQALIPGGPVNPSRAARDEILIETRADTEDGRALITGETVSTPVRKLFEAKLITTEQLHAAQLFQRDHDIAYAACINPLAAVYVDSSGSGAATGTLKGLQRRAHHGLKFQRARAFLGQELSRVALAAIVESPEAGIEPSFTAIGADTLVGCSKQEQRSGGRDAVIRACRMLALFYGVQNPDKRRINMEA